MAKILLSLSAVVFWIIILIVPEGEGEDYIYMLGWMAAGLLSSASALPALYFAIREKTNLLWWLIVFVNLSPGIWFFLILPHFAPDPNATQ